MAVLLFGRKQVTECYNLPASQRSGGGMRHRIPTVSGIPGGLIAGGVVVSVLMLASAAGAAGTPKSDNPISENLISGRTSATPTVTRIPSGSGIHGYPYDSVPTVPTFPGAPTLDLSRFG